MANSNPPPQLALIGAAYPQDAQELRFFLELLWKRTGGGDDLVGSASTGVEDAARSIEELGQDSGKRLTAIEGQIAALTDQASARNDRLEDALLQIGTLSSRLEEAEQEAAQRQQTINDLTQRITALENA